MRKCKQYNESFSFSVIEPNFEHLRESQKKTLEEFVNIFKFQTLTQLDTFVKSADRERMIKRCAPWLESKSSMTFAPDLTVTPRVCLDPRGSTPTDSLLVKCASLAAEVPNIPHTFCRVAQRALPCSLPSSQALTLAHPHTPALHLVPLCKGGMP